MTCKSFILRLKNKTTKKQMSIITLEGKAYEVSEAHLKMLLDKQKQINDKPYYHGSDVEMDGFINTLKPSFKCLGYIEFDFRL